MSFFLNCVFLSVSKRLCQIHQSFCYTPTWVLMLSSLYVWLQHHTVDPHRGAVDHAVTSLICIILSERQRHTRSHVHARTHTLARTRACTHTLARTHSHVHACTHMLARTRLHTHARTYTLARTRMHTRHVCFLCSMSVSLGDRVVTSVSL